MSAVVQEDAWRLTPMQASHLQAVMTIELRAYPFPWTEGIFKDCLRSGYSAWVMTDAGGRIHGYAVMTMAVGEAHVLNLCIDPAMQRRGLGRMLLSHLMTLARAAHCTAVLLEVRKSNKAALNLYRSMRFEPVGIRKAYYPAHGGREDACVLCHNIV
ncbi:MAG TPA: ribosomal protein S18-alanine N-acetyltransferase [Stenotrophobium sp.]|nr:ribosomal protein S18-alanine N-acetyltransferase [Stenotrophobium sp.]